MIVTGVALFLVMVPPQEGRPDQARIDAAVERGVAWLKAKVRAGLPPFPNDWKEWSGNQNYDEFVLYTLLHAGVERDATELRDLVRRVRRSSPDRVYGNALRAMALRALDDPAVRPEIFRCAQYLVDHQDKQGGWHPGVEIPRVDPPEVFPAGAVEVRRRMWAGGQEQEGYGVIYTQYAVLGLSACVAAGIQPPADCFPRAQAFLTARQRADGGWNYGGTDQESYGAMTSLSVAALSVCLRVSGNDRPAGDPRVQRGLGWLARNHSYDDPQGSIHTYSIYATEAAGSLAGVERLGERVWYAEGVKWLLSRQNADGTWGSGKNPYGTDAFDYIVDTGCALQFLRRASGKLLGSR
jgi:squalene cyclase